jgi:hypothetical protein
LASNEHREIIRAQIVGPRVAPSKLKTQRRISMTNSTSMIAAAPIVDALRPIISALVTTMVGLALTFGVALLSRWTGVTLQSTYVDSLRRAAQTEAGVLVAEAADNLSSRSISVASPSIAAAAARIAAAMPEAVNAVGMTPEGLSRLVAGEIGKLQAQATTIAVRPSSPPPASA